MVRCSEITDVAWEEVAPLLPEPERDETNQELDRYMRHLGLPRRDRGLGKLRPVE